MISALLFFPALIGLFVIWHIARPQKYPADASNRINKIRLLWIALKREDLFVKEFPWLINDEIKNVQPELIDSPKDD